MERGKGLEYSLCSFSMMFKRGIDGLLHANSIKMLVNDGEMLVNDGWNEYMIIDSFHHPCD